MSEDKKKIQVLVFDLNQTFYNKSSKDEFFKFVASKRPKRAVYYFQMLYYKLMHNLNQMRQTEFKENFFNYLDHLPPQEVEAYAKEFWQQEYPDNFNKALHKRFEEARKDGIKLFCAAGGLELYVKPLFELFKINGLAGTRVKYEDNTYKVIGKACKDEEKISRLNEFYKDNTYTIVEAYSDSKEDILDAAQKAYLVKDGEIKPYQKNGKS
ncbi:HAD superfamily phosphoserine phosphatase-like hydrolase [Pontibacter aydingkolensis]|uniref:HAD-IB family phosphatase n=1 Tax=Pontibacter aydingkolensis TaxID=1911536 RepID=A0ABS7CXX0_9BACT|nr:HAD-IB family phosphatase [Pontibacter aydingkolensis]MBW7468704.1 HAD-IB family phosphatase [Pontibacter aydingkolensis]